jgi:hypothetical protein
MRFGTANHLVMNQKWAHALWDIACVAKAATEGHADQDKIITALKCNFDRLEADGMMVPQAGFTWRTDVWDIKK